MPSPADAYEILIPVDAADIDELDHVNNVTYLRWVQEAATAHWHAAAPAADVESVFWVVLRHEIDYKQAARAGDTIRLRTWVGASSRVKFERFTEIARASDAVVLATARTLWCPIDAATRRPKAVSAAVRAIFSRAGGEA